MPSAREIAAVEAELYQLSSTGGPPMIQNTRQCFETTPLFHLPATIWVESLPLHQPSKHLSARRKKERKKERREAGNVDAFWWDRDTMCMNLCMYLCMWAFIDKNEKNGTCVELTSSTLNLTALNTPKDSPIKTIGKCKTSSSSNNTYQKKKEKNKTETKEAILSAVVIRVVK